MPNRLAEETSPYLLQHKDNPVDWHPWDETALAVAKEQDRPIFLSIGYSACHWCHVMERESFENEAIAAQMNELFVNIKVDREERPDIDSIYMAAVQAMTGRGGWPMSVFLTPQGQPYFAGTYFPPEDRGGMPSFPRVLLAAADAYVSRKQDVIATTGQVVDHLKAQTAARSSSDPLVRDLIDAAYRTIASLFDSDHGGFSRAPKFPQAMTLELLLRQWHHSGDPRPLEMAELTLTKMARGGIYDQLGGGFHRYATDNAWLIPHFEKMLYDNALLASLYTHAYQATGNGFYRRIAVETLDYVEREILHESGGFFSAQDADSEGEEGKFFVWDAVEVDDIVGPGLAPVARAYYGLSDAGNFEGRSILWTPEPDDEVAAELSMTADELTSAVAEVRAKLFAVREKRVRPARDDKVLTSWNALMIRAFAEAGAVFDEPRYTQIAANNADFLLTQLVRNGRLLRTWKEQQAKLNGYLEDYAFLIDALLSLYEATFHQRWLDEATSLAKRMIELFWDAGASCFFDTGSDHEQLLVRPRDIFDNATPSGGAMAATALLRLAVFTGNAAFERHAVESLRSVRDLVTNAPAGFSQWLAALDFYVSTPREIVIIGPPEDSATQALLRVAYGRYLPNRAIAGAEGATSATDAAVADATAGAAGATATPAHPLLADRGLVDGKPAAYVCENYACQLPVTDPDALEQQLEA